MSGARQPLCGILNIDKPLGWTSHDVVALVRRLSGQRQVGHAGTLDPLATGVLLVALGAATRLTASLMHGRKCYLARVRLGIRTTTDDGEGQVMVTRPTDRLTRERVIAALAGFRGDVRQVPPSYAAIKQSGVPAYKLARQGTVPELPARAVRIDGLALLSAAGRLEADVLDILIWCSAGTYIRALARDLGEALGCGGHLQALRRLSSGAFGVEGAMGVTALRRLAAEGRLHEQLYPMDEAVASWPALVVDDATAAAVQHGQAVAASDAGPPGRQGLGDRRQWNSVLPPAACRLPPDQVRIYARDGRLLALARYDARRHAWQPWKVLAPAGLSAEGRSVSPAEPGPSNSSPGFSPESPRSFSMKVVESLEALRYDQPLVLVIGSFDGVHRGHIYLLMQARERAREHHLAFGIITFDPAPALVLRTGLGDYQITGRDLKVALLAALEPDLLAVLPFTRALAALTAKQFIDTLEDGLQLAELWVGDDFRFGHDREGGIPYLLERARNAEFAVHVVARQGPQAGVPDVSSSAIREAIHAGDVRLASEMLGRPFELSGVVIRGHGRGRALGYPTANLAIPQEQIVPGAGVYAAVAELPGERFAAAASVGTNPQFGDADTSVEAYLLDFDRNIYDQTLRLLFVERLRDQARFESLDLLCAQITADVENTRRIINIRQ